MKYTEVNDFKLIFSLTIHIFVDFHYILHLDKKYNTTNIFHFVGMKNAKTLKKYNIC